MYFKKKKLKKKLWKFGIYDLSEYFSQDKTYRILYVFTLYVYIYIAAIT